MRFLAVFALVIVGIAFAQSQLVVPQVNNLNAVIALLPQLQGFIGQLDKILPQLSGILSPAQLQSFQQQAIQLVLSQVGGNLNANALKDKFLALIQQYVGSDAQNRIDWGSIVSTVGSIAVPAIISLIGKREAVDARAGLDDILGLVNKLPLGNLDAILGALPQLSGLVSQLNGILAKLAGNLSPAQLQSLQQQVLQLVMSQVGGGNFNVNAVKAKLQALLQQYLGSNVQIPSNLQATVQQIINTVISRLPGLLGKREAVDARASINDIVALATKVQLNTLFPQISQFLDADKLQQLQNQVMTTVLTALGNKWNAAKLGQALQQLITQYVPQTAQMRIDIEALGQSFLNGVVSALPGLALSGLAALFG